SFAGRRSVPRANGGRKPEVEQNDTALRRDHHVRRLDVPVQLSCGVDRLDSGRKLSSDVCHLSVVNAISRSIAYPRNDVRAGDELHCKETMREVREELEELDEVRMSNIGKEAKLSFQSIHIVWSANVRRFERDLLAERVVERPSHHPAAPFAEFL